MLVSDLFRLATRMFRVNRSRTLLTILGISVGIAAILFLVSLGYGLQKIILDKITSSDALLSLDVSTGDAESLVMNENTAAEIKAISGVEKTSPLVSASAQMTIDGVSSELTAHMANSEYFLLDGTILKKGKFYTEAPEDENKVLISAAVLQLFDLSEDAIFEKKLNFSIFKEKTEGTSIISDFLELEKEFYVIGIIDDSESSFVYFPASLSKEQGIGSYSKIKVKVMSDKDLDPVRTAIIDKGLMVSALSDTIEQANQIFKIVQIILASFGIVALIVSAIGMFNTMTITLLERTQEIGIMKTLGAASIDIWNMFLSESIIIGFSGGFFGIIIGSFGGIVFNYLINLMAGAFGGEKIDMFYTPLWFIVLIITFSTFVGLITGFYPAKRAARINALEALRYK